jgi:hypothetical protein
MLCLGLLSELFLQVRSKFDVGIYNCQTIKLISIYANPTYTINLNCFADNLTSIYAFGVSNSYTDDLNNQLQCMNATKSMSLALDAGCSVENWLNAKVVPQCQSKLSCSVAIDTTQLKSLCKPSYTQASSLYLSYTCYSI